MLNANVDNVNTNPAPDTNADNAPKTKYAACDHCGQIVPADKLTETADGTCVCNDCLGRDYEQCEKCGDWYKADECEYVEGYGYVCKDCRESGGFAQCDRCGDWYRTDELTEVHTDTYHLGEIEFWCEDCVDRDAETCEECGDVFSSDCTDTYSVYGHDDMTLCSACAEEHTTCADCGCLILDDDDVCCDDYDSYCPNCYRDHRGAIEPYGHTYASHFYREYPSDIFADARLYLGVELETEYPSEDIAEDAAQDVIDTFGDRLVCVKSDSSLDDGAEIVTQPCTPLYHLAETVWPEISRICLGHNGTSHDNGRCGLHIHISRTYLDSENACMALDRLIQTHPCEWGRFSRRQRFNYCKIESEQDLGIYGDFTPRKKQDAWKKRKGCGWGDRYCAVNFNNAATVEVRLWRGSLNPETILAAIEASTGLAIVAKRVASMPEVVETATWSEVKGAIVAALESTGLSHSELDSYVSRRGL